MRRGFQKLAKRGDAERTPHQSKKSFRRRAGLLVAALLLAVIAGCSQQTAPPTPQPDIENLATCERISMTRTIKLLKRDGRLPKSQWATAGAVAKAESSLCKDAYNSNTNGSVDRGLYQINSIHGYSANCFYNASCNTKAAVNIYRQRGNWTAWVAYNSGAYKQYLGQARRAVRKVSGGKQYATGTVPAGYTVNLRSGPGTNYRVVGQKTGGQNVTIVCHKRGTRVKGPSELGGQYSRLWDKLASGKWISDAYVYTGSMNRVAPWCKGHEPSPSKGRIIGDNYPYKNGSTSGVDPWNFYIRQCVSFATWRVRKVKNVKFHNYFRGVHWGNANNWDDAARAAGVRVAGKPRVGDIAHWEAYQRGSLGYGHVAYVAKVHGNGDITVEEYNWKPYAYGTRRISAAGLSFIRF